MGLSAKDKIILYFVGFAFLSLVPTWFANQIQDEKLYWFVWDSSVCIRVSILPLLCVFLVDSKLLKTLFTVNFYWTLTNMMTIYLDYTSGSFAWMMHIKIGGASLILLYYLYGRWKEYVGTNQSVSDLYT